MNTLPRSRTLALLALAWLSLGPAPAQPLQNALFTVATSAKDDANEDWAFVLFQLTADPESLLSRRLAVYHKPGAIGTPGDFQKSGVAALQASPLVLKVLLQRAAAIGQAPGDLNFALDELFGEFIPDPSIGVEEKLSAVIRGSTGDPQAFGNLMLLARMHPGVSLGLGLAHAQRIGAGISTFEIRELGPGDVELGVVGRVEVDTTAPVVLPAPGAPVEIPEYSPMGHLNARLRWAAPDSLRRLSLLQYGYNVYRVDPTLAQANNWDLVAPPHGLLPTLAQTDPGNVRRVNRAPVLPRAIYDAVSVLDLADDPNTFFLADDNDLSQGGQQYVDGDRFYYYVAARDVLGRDGLSSEGSLVILKDRIPPHAPKRPDVSNVVGFVDGEETHHLQVTWRQSVPTPKEPISGYYVHRWSQPGDVQKFGADPLANRISGFIPHQVGETYLHFVDDGLGSPTVPDDYDKTYWYTVRAVKPTVDGGNLSPNSAPAFGVLRNRFAPEAGEADLYVTCCLPLASTNTIQVLPAPEVADPLRVFVDLVGQRSSRNIAWIEFAIDDEREPAGFVGRFHFLFFRKQLRHRIDLGRRTRNSIGAMKVFARVGDGNGNFSSWVSMELPERDLPADGHVARFIFRGEDACGEVKLDSLAIAAGCDGHSPGGWDIPLDPVPPPGDGENPANPIKLDLKIPEFGREYRVYRRVDGGNLTLWRQGLDDEADADSILLEDGGLPANAGEVSYFGQWLDDNGNASELKLIGTYVAVKQAAPAPMLAPPEVDGAEADPRLKLIWFCPPHGVERFELILAVEPGPIPNALSPILSVNQNSVQEKIQFAIDQGNGVPPQSVKVGIYQTPSLEGGFGPGPRYELSIPVVKGSAYKLQVRAIAKSGGPDGYSQYYDFQYPTDTIEEATGPDVPWPARPLLQPSQSPPNENIIALRILSAPLDAVGIRIGQAPGNAVDIGSGNLIGPNADLRDHLYPAEDESSGKLLPLVLYRYQVPSDLYPTPSADLIQVSPLMRDIPTATVGGNTQIRDPFVKMVNPGTGPTGLPWNIVLLDTQPAVRGAAYAYVIVRFHPNGEVASVHPLAPLLVQ